MDYLHEKIHKVHLVEYEKIIDTYFFIFHLGKK